jgi:hypothetical protein
MIQFLRLPGKSGKVRKRVGNVASDAVPSGITIPCAEPKPVVHADGTRSTKVTPLVDPAFDFLRFRRALHHVGFNTLVLRDGVDRAYEGRYDAVRRYVRHPHKGESWPFVQYVELEKGLARDVTVLLLRDPSTEFAGLVLGKAAAVAVDLTNSGGLAVLAQSQFPPGAAVIDSSYRVPRAQRETGARRYRVTISIDD